MKHPILLTVILSVVIACPVAAQTDDVEASSVKLHSYTVPKTFQGIGGVLPDPKSAEFVESGTSLEEDDVFMTLNLRHVRTGVLENDLVYSQALNALDSDKTVPAGTLMYANTYGRSFGGTTYSPIMETAWCAIQPEKKKTVCIFWGGKPKKGFWQKKKENPESVAEYVEVSKGQSQYYVNTMTASMHRDEGTVPIIKEQAVDFGRDFIVEFRFEKFKKKRVVVEAVFLDGDKEVNYTGLSGKLNDLSLDESGAAVFSLMGKKIKLSRPDPKDKKKAVFEILTP